MLQKRVVGVLLMCLIAGATLAQDTKWREVKNWSGSGAKTTESFAVSSSEWRVRWTASKSQYGVFQIYVYDDKDRLVSLAANNQGGGSDTSYVRGAGRHHMMINAANVEWTVSVEDGE